MKFEASDCAKAAVAVGEAAHESEVALVEDAEATLAEDREATLAEDIEAEEIEAERDAMFDETEAAMLESTPMVVRAPWHTVKAMVPATPTNELAQAMMLPSLILSVTVRGNGLVVVGVDDELADGRLG